MKTRLWPILIVSALIFAAMLGCGLQGDYPAPALGVFVDGNLGVVEVLAGGAAEKAGVQVGDVLVSLNFPLSGSPSPARSLMVWMVRLNVALLGPEPTS